MTTSKQGRKRIKEPRKGALAAALAALLAVAALAGYFLFFAPPRKTDIPQVKSMETRLKTSPVQPYSSMTSVIMPEQKPPLDKRADPEKGGIPPGEISALNLKRGTAYLAIIIDDMGRSMSEARSLAAIGVPLNFSIIPGLSNYREVAEFAGSRGIETMIHIPMQSKGWPERRLEANGLLLSMDDAELRERVSGFIQDIPGVVGANNHMGSEFTEHEEKMRIVLGTLKSKKLFFIDSVTSIQTTGLRLAREIGIKSAQRHVFLDNEKDRSYILGQLGQAIRLAKKSGFAIAICHPHPLTIATLASALPGLAGQGVTLVPVSQLVR